MSELFMRDDDGIVHIRNSERGTLDRCPQQWWWAWREGLRPKETAKPLWFGTGIHLALAHYYGPGRKRRKDFIDVWREFASEEAEYMRINLGGVDEDEWVEAKDLGESMLAEYVREYGGDKHWDVIATEQTFEVQIPYRLPDGMSKSMQKWFHSEYGDYFILNGTFDGVYRDTIDRKVKLMEHKTAGYISVGHLPMDNQGGTYWMVAQTVGVDQGWLKPKQGISEITYNFLRKTLPDPRPQDREGYRLNKPTKDHFIIALDRAGVEWEKTKTGTAKFPTVAVMEEMAAERGVVVLGDRSKSQPPLMFERHGVRRTRNQRRTQLHRLQSEVVKMLLYTGGVLEVTKAPDRNKCSFCSFKDMCELHESGGGWTEYRDALYRSQDPYADHRKSAAL